MASDNPQQPPALARFTRAHPDAPRCEACLWRCELPPGTLGTCQMRSGHADGIVMHNHTMISGAGVMPIEDHRLWHFFPDTLVLAVGSWGYAFPVDQRRGDFAALPDDPAKRRELSAERVAAFALKRLCRGVVWAYGEPAVSAEYALDVLRASRAASRYTALMTTGYMTIEVLDAFGPYLDGICLDVRGFGDAAYARLSGAPHWQQILETAAHARKRWHCHVELVTRVHHRVNDEPDDLRALVLWVSQNLGPETPWHVLAGDAGAETAAAVVRTRRIGHEGGLHYVYGPETNQSTQCPQCGHTLITRDRGVSRMVGLSDGRCTNCGFAPYIRTSLFKKL